MPTSWRTFCSGLAHLKRAQDHFLSLQLGKIMFPNTTVKLMNIFVFTGLYIKNSFEKWGNYPVYYYFWVAIVYVWLFAWILYSLNSSVHWGFPQAEILGGLPFPPLRIFWPRHQLLCLRSLTSSLPLGHLGCPITAFRKVVSVVVVYPLSCLTGHCGSCHCPESQVPDYVYYTSWPGKD